MRHAAPPLPDRPTRAPAPWAESLFTVGVTGTNGKTSTTLLVAELLRAAGQRVVAQTTLGASLASGSFEPREAADFMERIRRAADAGARYAAVEVTSEALAAGWAKRWRFDLGVFTNLSHDHLDAHRSFEHYLASKAQLFVHLGPGRSAVLNASDPTAPLLDRVTPADVRRWWYACPSRGPACCEPDLAARELVVSARGTRVELEPSAAAEQLGGALEIQLVGHVFAENALAAACVGLALELDGQAVRQGLSALAGLPGRFEVVEQSPVVAVDYAHTPDALARTCETARAIASGQERGRVIVVFGAGGNRDPAKRRPMGEAVGSRADLAIVTSDNPRDEDPRTIARAVASGCRRGGRAHVLVELDRRKAIRLGLESARPDDVLVIAGKGHETGQTIRGRTLPFSDAEEVRRACSTGGSARRRARA
jgi:UDP-N-acetylmuramoyl-L-alanyl-D-glutamate--2,6-diaminopimelate ligase